MTPEEYQQNRATFVSVDAVMDTNAGDEQHRDANWRECAACGYDNPADYADCTFCGAGL